VVTAIKSTTIAAAMARATARAVSALLFGVEHNHSKEARQH